MGTAVLAVVTLAIGTAQDSTVSSVVVGSKQFTEGVVLGEVVTLLARSAGYDATHRRELGGTQFVWRALLRGDIDAYVEYTGTIREEIFAGQEIGDDAGLRAELARLGVRATAPLGFNNTYALAMASDNAVRLGIARISDLRAFPDLVFGFTNELLARGDGWPSLDARYQLPQRDVRGMEHDLSYRGLDAGAIDVIDVYSTDAEIDYYGLRLLDDDLGHFPRYEAIVVYRDDLPERAPGFVALLPRIEGAIDEGLMASLNARAKLDGVPERVVAADFLDDRLGIAVEADVEGRAARLRRYTGEHLALVGLSLLAAMIVAVPLGVTAALRPGLGQVVLGGVGIVQTIPSLALLVFMIPLLGIGAKPAIAALFLYSLLPIVRNTHAGLVGIPGEIREAAEAIGLPRGARLRLIELPMASRAILAGIKTSAVINIGTATLGALVGAGGYGQPILTGIRLDNIGLILEGAVPAALLALLAQGLFDLGERVAVPRGLR